MALFMVSWIQVDDQRFHPVSGYGAKGVIAYRWHQNCVDVIVVAQSEMAAIIAVNDPLNWPEITIDQWVMQQLDDDWTPLGPFTWYGAGFPDHVRDSLPDICMTCGSTDPAVLAECVYRGHRRVNQYACHRCGKAVGITVDDQCQSASLVYCGDCVSSIKTAAKAGET